MKNNLYMKSIQIITNILDFIAERGKELTVTMYATEKRNLLKDDISLNSISTGQKQGDCPK